MSWHFIRCTMVTDWSINFIQSNLYERQKSRHHQLCTKMRSIPERIGPETTSRQSSTSTYSRPKVQEPRNCRLGWRTLSNFTPPRHVLNVELIEFMGQATEDTRRGKFVNDRLLAALYKSWAHAKRDAWCKQHTVPHTVGLSPKLKLNQIVFFQT